MTVEIALRKFESMKAELGKTGFTVDYRDFTLQPRQTRTIEATDLLMIVLDTVGSAIVVRSQLGVYDHITTTVAESVHHHTGRIVIENHSQTEAQYVEFAVANWY